MKKIRVACLPVAGKANPYQHLMMQGLNNSGRIEAFNGVHDKFFGIFRTCLKFNPDIIHFDWETSFYYRKYLLLTLASIPIFIIQVLICRYIFGCKVVWTPHNIRPHDLPYPRLHRFIRRFFANQVNWIRLFSKRSLNAASLELLQPESKFRIVPEGSYLGYYPEEISGESSLNSELGIPDNNKILLYLGLIKPYKELLELVSLFQENKFQGVSLLICGKSMNESYYQKICDKSEGNNSILIKEGFVPEEKLPDYYKMADAVILPFRKIENSGSVIMAMGYKKAVIAPDMGVVPDRLCRQPDLLFKDSPEKAIQKFLSLDKDDLQAIGKPIFWSLLNTDGRTSTNAFNFQLLTITT